MPFSWLKISSKNAEKFPVRIVAIHLPYKGIGLIDVKFERGHYALCSEKAMSGRGSGIEDGNPKI
jgi:hypothetical protein